jgi:hypothetical protein
MSRWIPAAVELPDSDTDVIVAAEDGHVEAGFHDGRVWRWLNACRIDIDVTHWMPFPNPPEGAK